MAAALVPRELTSWSLTAVPLGALEGGLLGIIVKSYFGDSADSAWVNLAVAIVAGAPAFTNLFSFAFASYAQGRDKLIVLSSLMVVMGACLVLLALPTASAGGLVAFTALAVTGRAAWSGILTVRAAVWRANYERRWRGQVTARIVQLASLIVAASSTLIGFLMDWSGDAWRAFFPFAGLCAFAAAWVYRGARIRRHRRLIRAELAEQRLQGSAITLGRALTVLRENREFRRYMAGMMVFGSGNLMVIALLVVMMNEYFEISRLSQVLITSSLPLLVLFATIGLWARLLDERHIFSYRAIHSWNFVAALALFALAVTARQPVLLWPGSILLGSAYAGGHLGWNLGHNDFSEEGNSSLYMAIHVSLTGLRGLVMPILGVALFQWLENRTPGSGAWAMLLPVSLTTAGACGFVWLHLQRKEG
jgi:hypothetical protein